VVQPAGGEIGHANRSQQTLGHAEWHDAAVWLGKITNSSSYQPRPKYSEQTWRHQHHILLEAEPVELEHD